MSRPRLTISTFGDITSGKSVGADGTVVAGLLANQS